MMPGRTISLSARCRICSQDFPHRDALKIHNANVHLWNAVQVTFYDCSICCDRFIEKEEVVQHILEVHSLLKTHGRKEEVKEAPEPPSTQEIAPSPVSEEPSNSREQKGHTKEISPSSVSEEPSKSREQTEQGLLCLVCQETLPDTHQLLAHLESHQSSGPEQQGDHGCPVCPDTFSAVEQLRLHIQERHPVSFECPECSQALDSEALLQEHVDAMHKAETCPLCEGPFQGILELSEHLKEHHSGSEDSSPAAEEAGRSPKRARLGPEGLECSVCSQMCKSALGLIVHKRRAHGIKMGKFNKAGKK